MLNLDQIKDTLRDQKFVGRVYRSVYRVYYRAGILLQRRRLQKYGGNVIARLLDDLRNAPMDTFAIYGTLLGLIREHGFIWFDSDIDFGVITDTHDDLTPLLDWLIQRGYTVDRGFEVHGRLVEFTIEVEGLGVDFFWFGNWEDRGFGSFVFYGAHKSSDTGDQEYRVAHISCSPIRNTQILHVLDQEIPIPEKAERFLEEVYTSNWRTPDPNWVASEGPAWSEATDLRGRLITFK